MKIKLPNGEQYEFGKDINFVVVSEKSYYEPFSDEHFKEYIDKKRAAKYGKRCIAYTNLKLANQKIVKELFNLEEIFFININDTINSKEYFKNMKKEINWFDYTHDMTYFPHNLKRANTNIKFIIYNKETKEVNSFESLAKLYKGSLINDKSILFSFIELDDKTKNELKRMRNFERIIINTSFDSLTKKEWLKVLSDAKQILIEYEKTKEYAFLAINNRGQVAASRATYPGELDSTAINRIKSPKICVSFSPLKDATITHLKNTFDFDYVIAYDDFIDKDGNTIPEKKPSSITKKLERKNKWLKVIYRNIDTIHQFSNYSWLMLDNNQNYLPFIQAFKSDGTNKKLCRLYRYKIGITFSNFLPSTEQLICNKYNLDFIFNYNKIKESRNLSKLNRPDSSIKETKGKLRYELIPISALEGLAKVYTYGAEKYSDNTWQQVPKNEYVGALFRHLVAWIQGEKIDKESGLLHLDHILANISFIKELDD